MRIGGAPFNQPGEAENKLEEIKKLVQIAEELARSHDQLEARVADLEKQLEDAGRISG